MCKKLFYGIGAYFGIFQRTKKASIITDVYHHAPVRPMFLLFLLILGVAASTRVLAVTVVNPGFNDLTGWITANDATLAHPGGTAPWSWNTPVVVGTSVNSTETILPTEGTGLGITYAGADSFTQTVNILTAGDYVFSVDANAVTGTSSISGLGDFPLIDGRFQLFGGSASSPDMTVVTTNGWENFSWTTTLSAGLLDIGLSNTLSRVYSITYDNYSITAVNGVPEVPVPAAVWLFGTALIGLVGFSKRRKAA